MTTMTHEGYVARLEIDVEAGEIHGEVVNTKAVLTFSASSVGELAGAFRDTIEVYKGWCAERGEPVERPYSGNLSLRISPQLHRELASAAAERGGSINTLVSHAIAAAIGAPSPVVTNEGSSFIYASSPSAGDTVLLVSGNAYQAMLATGPIKYTQLAGPVEYVEPIEFHDALPRTIGGIPWTGGVHRLRFFGEEAQ